MWWKPSDVPENHAAVAREAAMNGRDLNGYERLAYFLRAYRLLRHEQKMILDVGSGFGIKSFYIARLFPDTRVLGIDTGIEVVERGNKIKEEQGIQNVDFVQMDICDLEDEERFDLVIMSDVLEHVENDELALRNARRSLKRGGVLYVHAPLVDDDFKMETLDPAARAQVMESQKRIGHVRLGYTMRQIRSFFDDGFRRCRAEECGWFFSRMAAKFQEYFCYRDGLDSIDEYAELPDFLFDEFRMLIDMEANMNGLLNFLQRHGGAARRILPFPLDFPCVHAWGRKA